VFADIQIMRPVSKVDDYFELLFYYPAKRVRLRCSYLVREPLPGYIVHGAKGSFIKTKTDIQEAALLESKIPGTPDWGREPDNEKGFLHTEKDGKVIKEHTPSFQGNYMEYFNGIYESIRNGKALPVTAEEGLNVIRIIEAAFKSSNEKRVIEIK